jgi:hypothetical protein
MAHVPYVLVFFQETFQSDSMEKCMLREGGKQQTGYPGERSRMIDAGES